MKNLINYYYNLMVSDIRRIDNKFLFKVDEVEYVFFPFFGDFENVYNIYNCIIKSGRYCHEIIFNKLNLPITNYDNIPYILLKKHINESKMITFDEILNYDVMTFKRKNINWKNLWKEKIDYYEYQISQMGIKYKNLSKSLNYYIGLCENAISLLNYVDFNKIDQYICHRRIGYKENHETFYNPLEMVVDNRTRDIGEYIKLYYINDKISINEIITLISNINLDYNESLLLLARLLYPTYYFDIYDEILQDRIVEEKIDFVIKKTEHCELLIKEVYKFMKLKYKIPEIEWLNII